MPPKHNFPHSAERKDSLQHPGIVDGEFATAESMPYPERLQAAEMLLQEMDDPTSPFFLMYKGDKNELRRMLALGNDGISHYFLPGIPNGTQDLRSVREGYDSRARYEYSAQRTFITVGQGEMWAVPAERNPYFSMSMSECSALFARTESEVWASHISYSDYDAIQKTLEIMLRHGARRQDIVAVASVGEYQKLLAESDAPDYIRATDISDYTALGILPEYVISFEHSLSMRTDDLNRNVAEQRQNLATVVADQNGVLAGFTNYTRDLTSGIWTADNSSSSDRMILF